MTRRSWPLQRALFGVNLLVALGGLGLFAGLSFFLVSRVFQSAFIEHFRANERLFIDSVTNDVLTGLDFEAYRKCKLFYQSGSIHSIRIASSSGRAICAIPDAPQSRRATNLISLESTVFFDERRTSPAATVSISFKDDTKRKLIRNFTLVLSLTTLCLALLLGVLVRVMSRAIAIPIRRLSDLLENADLELMAAENGPDTASPIHEVHVLYRTTARMAMRLMSMQSALIQRSKAEALANMASQVAHDIRSPLAALEVASGDVSQLPEDKRILIRAAVGRIRDIANRLLERQRARADGEGGSADVYAAPEAASLQLLSSLLDPVVSEKRLQFGGRSGVKIELSLDASSYGHFAAVQPVEFKRLLSNLVNNAVEAFGEGPGSVGVGLSSRDGRALVSVQDDGRGIPPEVLAKLGRRGETHGKAGGTGLGLYHARACAESWGGRLDIASQAGKGTTVTVTLPLASAPDWFVPQLALRPGRAVMVLDDDPSIHQVWQGRLDALKAGALGVEVAHASSPRELRDWVRADAARAREALYLMDYELAGHGETGLSLAEELGIGERAILVTSRHEEPAVLEGCRRLKARLIPKGLAGLVPMRVEAGAASSAGRERWDAVLIDDDALARATWELAAKRQGKRLRTFAAPGEFFAAAEGIDRGTPVYVDSELGEGVQGAEESRRVRELGFGEVYLATGHEPGRFAGLAHLRGVIGKEPPWGQLG